MSGKHETFFVSNSLTGRLTEKNLEKQSEEYKDIDYAEVKDLSSGKSLIVSEHYSEGLLKDSGSFELISKLKGSDLVGKKYLPIFDFFQDGRDIA
mgnify:CR=1 FL=1